jgi:5-methyltetrahydrofolate--homocysteine methyltransferase
MVPWSKILAAANENDADMIGLSGLITPSLDEMVTVAEEMKRAGMTMPLLIGGATTSKVHTALRISPAYDGPIVHVLDASRAVGVATTLVSDTQRDAYVAGIADEYEKVRVARANKGQNDLLPLAEARARGLKVDMALKAPPVARPGIHVFEDWDLADLRGYIDWTPFFRAWELAGNFPAILTDEVVGESATGLYEDAQAMLDRIIAEKWLTAKGVAGLWACHRHDDDVWVYTEHRESHRSPDGASIPEGFHIPNLDRTKQATVRLPFLRQQIAKREGRANMCLADFIDPAGDWMGGFAVGIHGIEPHLAAYKADHDDYNDILLKALADRLAEAFAERLHARVRTDLWGYAPGEQLTNDALVREQYRGIRPAPGYPACPEHSLKRTLFDMLAVERNAGLELTESFAMLPTAAVSGFYFGHAQAEYFGVARIGQDQVTDYAARRGVDVKQAERWLRPNLD